MTYPRGKTIDLVDDFAEAVRRAGPVNEGELYLNLRNVYDLGTFRFLVDAGIACGLIRRKWGTDLEYTGP